MKNPTEQREISVALADPGARLFRYTALQRVQPFCVSGVFAVTENRSNLCVLSPRVISFD
jgi:hypothetical protein